MVMVFGRSLALLELISPSSQNLTLRVVSAVCTLQSNEIETISESSQYVNISNEVSLRHNLHIQQKHLLLPAKKQI